MMGLAILPCAAIILVIASLAVITLLIAGRRDPSRPRCAACRATLSPAPIMRGEPCLACQAPLDGPRALLTSRRHASRTTWIVFAVIALFWVGFVVLAVMLSSSRARQMGVAAGLGRFPGPPAMMGNDELVVAVVNEARGNATAQAEFSKRAAAGEINAAGARATLLAELARVDPAHVTVAQPGALLIAQHLLAAKPDDHEMLDAILAAYEPAPALVPGASTPESIIIGINESPRRTHASRTIQPVLFLRRVLADGRPIPFSPLSGRASATDMLISPSQNAVRLKTAEIAGAAELTFEFEAMLFDWFDAQRVGGAHWTGAVRKDWPTPLRSHPLKSTIRLRGAEPVPALFKLPAAVTDTAK